MDLDGAKTILIRKSTAISLAVEDPWLRRLIVPKYGGTEGFEGPKCGL
jgi:hypothetical protein